MFQRPVVISGSLGKPIIVFGKELTKKHGENAFANSKPCLSNPKLRVTTKIEEKILYLNIQILPPSFYPH